MARRKRSAESTLLPLRASQRISTKAVTDPAINPTIDGGQEVLQLLPTAEAPLEQMKAKKIPMTKKRKTAPAKDSMFGGAKAKSELSSNLSDAEGSTKSKVAMKAATSEEATAEGTEAAAERLHGEVKGEEEDVDLEEINQALSRPPPVNSSYLPLPWKGRLGYACLNTYLRFATPPVFCSRTCRIASILEHRHPLKDPAQPEHAVKNRPDKNQPADVVRGQTYVEAIGLANAHDIPKMLRWNDRYGIKFLRLSSEMFPFASHEVYGYKLRSFASEALAEAGRVATDLGHRLTTHPGQFTQLGSPRPEVIKASFRDLEYHCELLNLLNLPSQQDRDAVMVLHMGGVFGDKNSTLERFRGNYAKLPQKVKSRLVLENDDVCYTVHDLLPICEELNIPLVLDFHHHNILFDTDKIREGTLDIMNLYDRIKATWDRKNITQKMHYSEPTPGAITNRQRRKHSPRVATLPPCTPDMDLMIEAKDKEQAVFELMRTFKLPGFDKFSDIISYTRNDENKPLKPTNKKISRKKKSTLQEQAIEDEAKQQPPPTVPDEEVSMGGPEGRVYWPPGMEEWLRPKKREVKARDPVKARSTAAKAAGYRAEKAAWQAAREASADGATVKEDSWPSETKESPNLRRNPEKAATKRNNHTSVNVKKHTLDVPTPSTSDPEDPEDLEDQEGDVEMPHLTDAEESVPSVNKRAAASSAVNRRQSGRGLKRPAKSYAEEEDDNDDE